MTSPSPSRVLIAGGGLAGIEAALALRAAAGDRASVTVIDPRPRFQVPSTAAGRAFDLGWSIDQPMGVVVEGAGARLRRGRLAAIDGARRIAMLAGGELMPYDHLVVAVGGRPQSSVTDALTFRGHDDAPELRALVDGIADAAARGARTELAIVVPRRCAWPLTAYEIALMTHDHLAAAGVEGACRIQVVTAEERPLAAFAGAAGDQVLRTLARAGVLVRAGAAVRAFRWGRLEIDGGDALPADRVVALPTLIGPAIEGLPADDDGFVVCDPDGRIADAPGVRVIGDACAGATHRRAALACRQADRAAAAIARDLGLPADDGPADPCDPDAAHGLPWPSHRVPGRHLTPFLTGLSRPMIPA